MSDPHEQDEVGQEGLAHLEDELWFWFKHKRKLLLGFRLCISNFQAMVVAINI